MAAVACRSWLCAFDPIWLTQAGFEGWKFTSSQQFMQHNFQPATIVGIAHDAPIIEDFLDLDAIKITMVNGFIMPELSDLDKLPKGLTVRPYLPKTSKIICF